MSKYKSAMAGEHLALLYRGPEVWNQWRQDNSHKSPNLAGCNLGQMDLQAFDLSHTDLTAANLRKANLIGVNLSNSFCVVPT